MALKRQAFEFFENELQFKQDHVILAKDVYDFACCNNVPMRSISKRRFNSWLKEYIQNRDSDSDSNGWFKRTSHGLFLFHFSFSRPYGEVASCNPISAEELFRDVSEINPSSVKRVIDLDPESVRVIDPENLTYLDPDLIDSEPHE